MPKKNDVLVTIPRRIPSLEERCNVTYGAIGTLESAVGLICSPTETLSADEINSMPALKAVAVAGAGLDGLDMEKLKQHQITVVSAGEATTSATAELTMALILMCARSIPGECERLRDGRWEGWSFGDAPGRDLAGAKLGLVGFGRIGSAVAARAEAFGMHVFHHARRPTGLTRYVAELDELVKGSDFLSVHVPLTDQTRGLIDARRLDLLPRGAVVVNSARGGIVDEIPLCDRLESGQIGAAGLDVFEDEPALRPRLLAAPNLVLTPHLGSATPGTRSAMAELAAARLIDALEK